MKRAGSEDELAQALSDWLYWQHRDIAPFAHFDYGSGLRMTMGQARRQKALNPYRGWPDFMLASPIVYQAAVTGGLFLELKKLGTRLKKRDGSWASVHIAEQAWMLERLREVGYVAEFAVGLDEAMRRVEDYLAPIKARDVRSATSVQNKEVF